MMNSALGTQRNKKEEEPYMLVKWVIGGAVLGAIAAILTGTSIGS